MPPTKSTTATGSIKEMIEAARALNSEFESSPFEGEIIEARSNITAAQALMTELEGEPETMSPQEIVEAKHRAQLAIQAAEIALRRAESKRDEYEGLLQIKLSELRQDALAVVTEVREAFEERIIDAFNELTDGFYSPHEPGYGTPRRVAMHRGREIRTRERILSAHDRVDNFEMIRRITAALECADSHA